MNKSFHSVWNASKQAYVAAAETISAKGKPSSGIKVAAAISALFGGLLSLSAHAQTAPPPNTLPTGGQVSAGQASISANGAHMVINQSSNRAAINWQSFNVGKDAHVQFQQPSAASVTLNRVMSADPSQIFGRISSNGQVILTNPSGVYFGREARVDVGGILATTHGTSDADFMAGKNRYERKGSTGSVINEGELKAALGGYIALLASEVRNQGAIIAHMGTAVLAAGEAVDLHFDSNNRLTSLRVDPSQIAALVDNRHAVQAPGGLVIISAQSLDRLVGGVVKNNGRIEANGLQQQGGRIMLSASHRVENTGSISANATAGSTAADSGPAGRIEISAPEVLNSGSISASGAGQFSAGKVQVQATNFSQTDSGSIDLSAPSQGGQLSIQTTGKVELQGSVNAQATQDTTSAGTISQGGQIEIAAQGDIKVNNAALDASGGQGGAIALRAKAPSQPDNPNPLPQTPDAPGQGRLAIMGHSTLSTRGRSGQGGNATLLGERIELLDTSALDATGAFGGGNVLVGGDWQGGANAERRVFADPNTLYQATTVTMAKGVSIDASAINQGQGGTIVLWSDIHNPNSVTRVYGTLIAQGGAQGGDGGQIETSGAYLDVMPAGVNATAAKGKNGEWLLDPYDITIAASTSGTAFASAGSDYSYTPLADSTVLASSLTTALNNGTNVTVSTGLAGSPGSSVGDITVSTAVNATGTGALTLTAYRNIAINANLNVSGGLTVNAAAGIDLAADLNSTGNINVNSPLRLKVGQSNITSSTGNLTFASTINSFDANTRALFLTATAGAIELNGAIGATRSLSYLGVNSAQGTVFRGGTLNLASGTIIQQQYGTYYVWEATPYYEASDYRYKSDSGTAVYQITSAPLRTGYSQIIFNNRAYNNSDGSCGTCGTVYPIGTLRITDASGATTKTLGSSTGSGVFNLADLSSAEGRVYFEVRPSEPNRLDTGMSGNPYYPYGGNATLQIYQGNQVIGYRDVTVNTSGQLDITGSFKFEAAAPASITGTISGTGSIIKAGAGALTLSGSNYFSGGTTLETGTLALGSLSALGSAGPITFSGGTLQYSVSNTVDYAGRFATTAGQHYKIDTNGQTVIFNSSNPLTSSGGQLTKLGSGTLAMNGANTYSGATTINSGTLRLNGTLSDSTAVTVISGAVYDVGTTDTVGSIASAGTVTTSTTGNKTLTVGGNNSSTTIAAINDGSGRLALTKTGTGTLTLKAIGYTGITTISAGTLVIASDAPTPSSTTFYGAGTLQIAPAFDDFSADLIFTTGTLYTTDTTGWKLDSSLGGLIIGKPSSADGITDRNVSIAANVGIRGPITVYGGDISFTSAGRLSTTSTSALNPAPILLKASNNISTPNITSGSGDPVITTAGGNLTLWSDSDGVGGGSISVRSGGILNSAGGRLTLAGGTTVDSDGLPAGFASSSTWYGVSLSEYPSQLTSGAGRLVIKGTSAAVGRAGVNLGGDIYTTSGAIEINGGTSGITNAYVTLGSSSATVTNTGPITLTGDYLGNTLSSGAYINNSALNVKTLGLVTIQPYSDSFVGTTASTTNTIGFTSNLAVSKYASGLTLGKPGNLSYMRFSGPLTLDTGTLTAYSSDLSITSALQANKIVFTTSVDNALAEVSGVNGKLTASNLLVNNFGTVSFNNNATNVIGTVAANNVGRLYLQNNAALTVGSITGSDGVTVNGITARENVWLQTITGNLTVGRSISTSNGDIQLVAGSSRATGYVTDDNLLLNPANTPTITAQKAGAPGLVTLYTGSIANSTGVTGLVVSGSGNFRYNSKLGTSNFLTALGSTGTYAIYREQPTVSVVGKDETITYGDTPTLLTDLGGTPVNGDTFQMIGVSATSPSVVYNVANTAAVAAGDNGTALYDAGTYTLRPTSVPSGTSALGYGLTGGTGLLTVNKRALTISGITASDKTYDGTRAASITHWGTFSGGLLGTETVGLDNSAATAQFDSANAGNVRPITVSGFTLTDGANGGLASNYQVSTSAAANINKALLSVSTTNVSKTYDGLLTANGTPTVVSGTLFVNVSNGSVQDSLSGGTYSFTDKNVGSGNKTVSVSGVTVSSGGNYQITNVDNTTSTINAANLTLSGTRAYDGGTTFAGQYLTAAGVNGETFGIAGSGGDSNLTSKHVAVNQGVGLSSLTGLTLSSSSNGGLSTNYNALSSTGSSVSVTQRNASVTGTTTNVTYNGLTQTQTAASTAGFVTGDTITISGLASGQNAATYTSNLAAAGADIANYNVSVTNANLVIGKANLTLSGTRAYDGSTAFAGQYLTASGVNNETFLVTGAGDNSNLSSKQVADNQGVTLNSITGLVLGTSNGSNLGLSTNYNALSSTGSSVSVTQRNASVTGTTTNVTYNGLMQAQTAASTAGFVTGDAITILGSTSGQNAATYTSNLAAAGADVTNYNVSVTNANLVIGKAPLTVTGTNVANKSYDGNAIATLSGGSLVGILGSDNVTLNEAGSFNDKDMGAHKPVTSNSLLGGVAVNNYALIQPTGLSASISRLRSVTWTGRGGDNNWFNPANWAGNAVPDGANVANVVIPLGASIIFGSDVVAPAQGGPVTIDSLGSNTGSLTQTAGTLSVGAGGIVLASLTQSGGSLTNTGTTVLNTLTQTGGSLQAGSNLTVSTTYSHGVSGSISVAGDTRITDTSGGLQLGNLTVNGNLTASSATGITLNGTVSAGSLNLTATTGGINQTGGVVNVHTGPAYFTAGGNIALGEIHASGDLVVSGRQIRFGTGTVDGKLSSTTFGAGTEGGVTQTGTLVVKGIADFIADTGAGQDAELLLNNNFKGGTNFRSGNGGSWRSLKVVGDSKQSAGDAQAKAKSGIPITSLPGTGLSNSNTSQPLVLSSGSSTNAAVGGSANANSTGVTVDLQNTSQQDTPLMVAVSLPKGASTVGTGFSFEMPESVKGMAGADTEILITQTDGSPLPAWLKFDQLAMRFESTAVPDSALPMQLLVALAGRRVTVVISERTE